MAPVQRRSRPVGVPAGRQAGRAPQGQHTGGGAAGADSRRRRRRGCSTWGGAGRGSTTARGAALATPATPQGRLESAAQQHLHRRRSDSCGPTARGAAAWGPSRVRPPALRRPLPPSSMLWLQALGFQPLPGYPP
ncbi:hypothetical protein PLESTB_000819100 [Pleodorina starrii]|uniref:Uncharacterized protein n=1 Tax=Pleodorina starrii TaxID=330485 RepID=A0A9W6F2P1_9CHLO|nr:hypothetical protein PLESTB_000819100 [Pleodorina starrii]GLC64633.1 hypothetical protein PLESTF_000187000 [Pleodorina starrii]